MEPCTLPDECEKYMLLKLMTIMESTPPPFDLLEGIEASNPKNWRHPYPSSPYSHRVYPRGLHTMNGGEASPQVLDKFSLGELVEM